MRRLRLREVDISSMRWNKASSHNHVTCYPPFHQVPIHLFVTHRVLRCSRGHLEVSLDVPWGPFAYLPGVETTLNTWESGNPSNSNNYCTLSNTGLLPLHLTDSHWTGEETGFGKCRFTQSHTGGKRGNQVLNSACLIAKPVRVATSIYRLSSVGWP